MKKHLIFVLIFLIITPILTVSWLWHSMIDSEQSIIQCTYEKELLAKELNAPLFIEYPKANLPPTNDTKHLRVLLLTLSFFVLGGYFFREYLMHLGKSSQQVSFVSQVSHELKTPLTNIKLYTDLLMHEQEDNTDAIKKLDVIAQETRRLEQLVNNVLKFANGEKLSLNKHPCNVTELMHTIARGYEMRFKQKGITLNVNSDVQNKTLDRDVIEQVLINLITNAEKYAADGKKIDIIATEKQDKLSIIVKDYGPGIPKHLREQIFTPFARGDNNADAVSSGLGIGLPLCRNLLRAHKGSLTLLDTQNGAAFEVLI